MAKKETDPKIKIRQKTQDQNQDQIQKLKEKKKTKKTPNSITVDWNSNWWSHSRYQCGETLLNLLK